MSCINPKSKEFQDILKYQPNLILAELEYNKLYPSEVDIDYNINTEIDQLKEEPFIPSPANDIFTESEMFSEEEVNWEHDITNDKNVYIDGPILHDLMKDPSNMIMTQENKNRFKIVESYVGYKEAFRDYMEQGQVVRPPYLVIDKINKRINQEDTSENDTLFPINVDNVQEIESVDFTALSKAMVEENSYKALDAITKLSAQLNIPYEIISIEDAKKQFPNKPVAKGYFYAGKVYLVEGLFNKDTVFHEFSHAVIKSLSKDNPQLFAQLYNSLKETSFGQDVIKKITSEYPEYDVDSFPFMEEAIVTALEFANAENAMDQKSFFGKIYLAIKQFLRKALGKKINISKLNPKTTLSEFLDMINQGEEFILDINFLDTDLLVMLQKQYEQEVNQLLAVNKTQTQTILNDIYNNIRLKVSAFKDEQGVYSKIAEELANENNTGALQMLLKLLNEAVTIGAKPITSLENLTEQEDVKDRLRILVKAVSMFDQIVPIYDKKIDALIASGVKTDLQFDQLYAISKYIDEWMTQFNPVTTRTYGETMKTSTESINTLFEPVDSLKKLFNNTYESLEKINKKINDVRFNSISNVLVEYVQKAFEPEIKKSLERLDKLKKANSITEYTREYVKFYGVSPSQKIELDNLTQLSNVRKLTKEEEDRLYDLKLLSYAGLNISTDQIKAIAQNEMGDSGWLNGMILAYNDNQNLVSGGFMNYIKQFFLEINFNIGARLGKLRDGGLDMLLKKAGQETYLSGPGGLGDKIKQVNKSFRKDQETKKLIPYYENQFISNFKDFQFDLKVLQTNKDAALALWNRDNTTANKDLYDEASKKLEEFENNYMHRDFVPEFYQLSIKHFSSPIGKLAKEKQDLIFQKLRKIDDYIIGSATDFSLSQSVSNLWFEYQQLASLYENGTLKTGDDLEIAKILKQFREESAEFYEWVEKPDAFNNQFEKYQQELISQNFNVGTPEYEAAINQWLTFNTTVSIKDSYWEERKALLDRKNKLLENLRANNILYGDTTPLYDQIYDILKKTNDTSGAFDGTLLNKKEEKAIKDLHERIELLKLDYVGLSGLSPIEAKKFSDIYDYYNVYNTFRNKDDKDFYYASKEKLRLGLAVYGISDTDIEEIRDIDKQIGNLSKTTPTIHYLNTFLNTINSDSTTAKMFNDYVANNFGIFLDKGEVISPENLHEILGNMSFIDSLLGVGNVQFQDWFTDNHFVKEILKKSDIEPVEYYYEETYVKTAAWSYSKPSDTDFYNSFTPKTSNYSKPLELNGIPRVPNRTYFDRQKKDKYKTQPIYRDYVDANGDLVLANKDNRGRWLPKTVAEGAKDDTYINKDYIDMFNNNRDLYNVMAYLKDFYLDNQEGLQVPQKMYLSYPRQLSTGYDETKRSTFKGLSNPISYVSSKYRRLLDSFKTSVIDDFTTDTFDPTVEYQQSSVYANITRPISGTYLFEVGDCSLDIIGLIQDNLRSIEYYKTFNAKNSFANMFQKQLKEFSSDPQIIAAKRQHRAININSPMTSTDTEKTKNLSNKMQEIDNFIERFFQGKNLKTTFRNSPGIERGGTRLVNKLSKFQAFKAFAFDPIKSLTNYIQGQSALIKKGISGKAFTLLDWIYTANLTLKLHAKLIYALRSKKVNSPDVELLILLDAMPGFFNKELADYKNVNLSKDASLSKIAYADRSFLNTEVEIHQMLAILNHNKFKFNGKTVTMFDVIETVDGVLQTKAGTPKEYSITYDSNGRVVLGDMVKKIMNIHQSFLQKNIGVANEMGTAEMYRSFIGKALFSMLKFIPGMTIDRYQAIYNPKTKQVTGRLNWATGERELGTYISAFALIGQAVRTKGNLKLVEQKYLLNMLEFLGGVMIAKLMDIFNSSIKFNDHDDDDKDKIVTLRENYNEVSFTYDPDADGIYKSLSMTTGLPNVPYIAPQYKGTNEFEANDWWKLQVLNLGLRVAAEEKTFFVWNPEMWKTGGKLVFGSSVFEESNVLFDIGKVTYYGYGALVGDKSAFYQEEAGPQMWQQKDSWKGYNVIGKSLGLSGNIWAPASSIKNRWSMATVK